MEVTKAMDRLRTGIQLVTFRLGGEQYGLPVWKVREIIRPLEIFPLPGMGERVEGVLNLRGMIIPVVKMYVLLGIPRPESLDTGMKRRTIILDASGGRFGFMVDEVMEVVRVSTRDIRHAPELGTSGIQEKALIGIAQISGRMVVCIDPEKLIPEDWVVKELSKETA